MGNTDLDDYLSIFQQIHQSFIWITSIKHSGDSGEQVCKEKLGRIILKLEQQEAIE